VTNANRMSSKALAVSLISSYLQQIRINNLFRVSSRLKFSTYLHADDNERNLNQSV